jgi:hypothetical protein
VLTVMEHIAIIQRAQAIAATDHAELVRGSAELAEARAQPRQLRRAAGRRRATAAAMLAGRARPRQRCRCAGR